MRYFFITCLLMYSIIPHANADDLMCLSLDGPADLEFNLTDADDFFNCVQIVSYSPAEELKITTVSDGMAHEVKVYDEDGNLEDRLQVGIQEFD